MRPTKSRLRLFAALLPAVLAAAACGAPTGGPAAPTYSSVPDKPSAPVELNVLDVAGNLQLTQGMIDEFAAANPDVVAKVNYTKATAPDMPGKLKAEQNAGRSQTHLVLTGTDGLAAVIDQRLALKVLPDYAAKFPGLTDDYLPSAAAMQELAQGQGVTVTYYPAGPLLEYDPGRVASPPGSADELLAWAKATRCGGFERGLPRSRSW